MIKNLRLSECYTHDFLPEKRKVAGLCKSCFICQRWKWCVTVQPPACCQSWLMSGGGQLHQQPEHLLVGVASATRTFLCLIRPYRHCVEPRFSPQLLFPWDAWKWASTKRLKGKVNIQFISPLPHVNVDFFFHFSGAAYYFGIVLVPDFDFLETVPDKASVGHVKVNIMVYIQMCHRLWGRVILVCLCFYRKIHNDRTLSFYFAC